jgi:hypothetical protein
MISAYPFTVGVGPPGADIAQELTDFSKVSMRFNRVTGDTLNFDTRGSSVEAAHISELATDVVLEGPIAQRYRVISVEQDWGENGEDVVTVQAVCYKRLLAARHVWTEAGLAFAGVDQGSIVWGLYQHTQAQTGGGWGVTAGSLVTGVTRDRNYEPGENLADLAKALQEVENGMWWWVDAGLQINAALPSTFPTHAHPLVRGVNARRLKRSGSGAGYANAARGDADPDTTVPVYREHVDIATDPRGRWEKLQSWGTVQLQDTLIEYTEGVIEAGTHPVASWTASIEPARWLTDSQYLPGSFVVLVIPPTEAAPVSTGARKAVGQLVELGIDINADGAVDVQAAFRETTLAVPGD